MDPFETFARQVIAVAESIRRGQTSLLDYRLTEAYHQLQTLAASLDRRLDVDEILNRILTEKVTRVHELLRILSGPDIDLSHLREANTRVLSGMLAYRRPICVSRLDPIRLTKSLDRLRRLTESRLSCGRVEDLVHMTTTTPPDRSLIRSEESLTLAEVMRLGSSLPRQRPIPIHEVVASGDIDEFFRRFLCVLILISRGVIEYDPLSKTILRP